MSSGQPSYVDLYESGELARRVEQAVALLADCAMCGRECHVDRSRGVNRASYCRGGRRAYVSSVLPHPGEEVCLSGSRCSGTIFFSRCNLRCVFCQNFAISWQGHGRPVQPEQLAGMMLDLQRDGCHNVNFVTPTHVVPQILEGLLLAVQQGLRLPLVYNTGGYDRVETLRLLEGVIDIYMPDFKFWSPEVSKELADADDYAEVARPAIKEMHRQVGDLVLDDEGLARRGLLVRHLVMPGGLEDTRRITRFLADEVSRDTFVNIMPQYHPEGLAWQHESINQPLTLTDYNLALAIAAEEGLWRLDQH
jgi:putative pyruvate formate lyase activating enzyme